MKLVIGRATLETLHRHACAAYPDECCGLLIERAQREEVVPVSNVQNQLHGRDPEQFPRTAATAYTMGPEAAPLLLAAERHEFVLRAFYHSHPEHDAYFSAEDRRQALGGWDEPNYPDTAQLVMSVRSRVVRAAKAFGWDAGVRDYVEIPILVR